MTVDMDQSTLPHGDECCIGLRTILCVLVPRGHVTLLAPENRHVDEQMLRMKPLETILCVRLCKTVEGIQLCKIFQW